MSIDRRAVVGRHDIRLSEPSPGLVVSVGNGDFAFTADITGLQTFTAYHHAGSVRPSLEGDRVTNTCTMSTWGWHEVPNPEGFEVADATSPYPTRRGSVDYPDRPSMREMMALAMQGGPTERADRAGMWLIDNPHRIDLGRIGLELRAEMGAEPETDPSVLDHVDQRVDLWRGVVTSTFTYRGEPVEVVTVASPTSSGIAFRVTSPLLATGRAVVRVAFPAPAGGFSTAHDWGRTDGHTTEVDAGPSSAVVHRVMDATAYDLDLSWTSGTLSAHGHRLVLASQAPSLEVVATFRSVAGPGSEWAGEQASGGESGPAAGFAATLAAAERFWESFWTSGGAIDTSGSTDPRAAELERRVVLSQYLTRVHGGGLTPPQETGFVTNSWQGKFHLEMHWWHAAHFALWGRPALLERSLSWYEAVHDRARATASRQGYRGARWPKQVGPEGRESPSDIGALLVWQQPHLMSYADLLHAAHAGDPDRQRRLVERLAPLLDDTADFMADFADEVDGTYHLGPPVMPAQEFYAARDTVDPTFELAYWWYGLEVAQVWRERGGRPRDAGWQRVQDRLAAPLQLHGRYAAVGNETATRPDDHPSMLMAYGFVPPTPLIDGAVVRATLDWVLDNWEWPTAWGWDFPVMAMTAARVSDGEAAVGLLLRDALKNAYDAAGHNPQMGSFLPLYLPGNGGLLAAVALMVAGWDDGGPLPGIPADGTWRVRHEGLVAWPSPRSPL